MIKILLIPIAVIVSILSLSINVNGQETKDVLQDTVKVLTEKDKQLAEKEYNKGVILLQSNKYNEAIESFDKAIKIKVKFPEAFFFR